MTKDTKWKVRDSEVMETGEPAANCHNEADYETQLVSIPLLELWITERAVLCDLGHWVTLYRPDELLSTNWNKISRM